MNHDQLTTSNSIIHVGSNHVFFTMSSPTQLRITPLVGSTTKTSDEKQCTGDVTMSVSLGSRRATGTPWKTTVGTCIEPIGICKAFTSGNPSDLFAYRMMLQPLTSRSTSSNPHWAKVNPWGANWASPESWAVAFLVETTGHQPSLGRSPNQFLIFPSFPINLRC